MIDQCGSAWRPPPTRRLADRERDSHDDARGARRNSEGEEVAHWAARVTERTHQRLGQQHRTCSRIDRSITAAAGERAGAEHARARRLPFLLEGGLCASASLELAVVDSAKHAHHRQSRRESFTAPALERSAQRTSAIQRCGRLAGAAAPDQPICSPKEVRDATFRVKQRPARILAWLNQSVGNRSKQRRSVAEADAGVFSTCLDRGARSPTSLPQQARSGGRLRSSDQGRQRERPARVGRLRESRRCCRTRR